MIVFDDDERHGVAERLRFFARETNGTSDFSMYLGHWVNADDADEEQVGNPFTVQANRKSAERTLEKLADLIDPTCKILDAHWDDGQCTWGCICSSCDAHLEHEKSEYLRYCPECGRRNVNAN